MFHNKINKRKNVTYQTFQGNPEVVKMKTNDYFTQGFALDCDMTTMIDKGLLTQSMNADLFKVFLCGSTSSESQSGSFTIGLLLRSQSSKSSKRNS